VTLLTRVRAWLRPTPPKSADPYPSLFRQVPLADPPTAFELVQRGETYLVRDVLERREYPFTTRRSAVEALPSIADRSCRFVSMTTADAALTWGLAVRL
jgi:hypothetical protein